MPWMRRDHHDETYSRHSFRPGRAHRYSLVYRETLPKHYQWECVGGQRKQLQHSQSLILGEENCSVVLSMASMRNWLHL